MQQRDTGIERLLAFHRMRNARDALIASYAQLVTDGGIRDPASQAIRQVSMDVDGVRLDDVDAMNDLAEDLSDRLAEIRDATTA